MSAFLKAVLTFFSASLTAIKGTINIEELWKVVLAASAAGGGVWTILTAIHDSLGVIITDPNILKEVNQIFSLYANKNYLGMGFFIAALVIDMVRRYNHGVDVTPSLPVIKQLNQEEKNAKVKIV